MSIRICQQEIQKNFSFGGLYSFRKWTLCKSHRFRLVFSVGIDFSHRCCYTFKATSHKDCAADATQSRQAGFVRYCLNLSPHKKSIPGGCSFCVLVYFSATICFQTCLLWSACWGHAVPFYLLGDLFLFCVLLWSACCGYAVRVYRMLGEMCVALFD